MGIRPYSREFGLDVVRVVAISLVLATHSTVFFSGFNPITFGVLPLFGVLGVELFFGLSGFLIGNILLDRRHSLGVFYLKRLMKIVPPYLAILLVIFILNGATSWGPLAAHLTFTQNFYPELGNYFPVSWSLAIEFWFYLLIPFLLLNRVAIRNNGKQLLMMCLGVALTLLIVRAMYVFMVQPSWEFGVHRFIPLRFDTLIFGVIAAIVVKQHGRIYNLFTSPIVVAANMMICLLLCMAFAALYFYNSFDQSFLLQTIGLSILGASIMLLVLAAHRHISYPKRFKSIGRLVTFISVTSYSLYLLHLFIFQAIGQVTGDKTMLYLLALATSIFAAWLFFQTIEKAALHIRDWLQLRFFGRQTQERPDIEAETTKQL